MANKIFFLDQIKYSFATFEHYLEMEQGLGHNISMKYSIVKQVMKELVLAE